MVAEFFEVVVDGFRWLWVVPSFSNHVPKEERAGVGHLVQSNICSYGIRFERPQVVAPQV